MEKALYTDLQIKRLKDRILQLLAIVAEIENEFPERHFTLDGHLVGSIGEVMAAYHYGVQLYTASKAVHDGEIDGRKVQIKITQQDNIVINAEPKYLLVLYLSKKGKVYEVYNGPGGKPWETASKRDNHKNRHMMVNKLMRLDEEVSPEERIEVIVPIEKMKREYKNNKI